VKIAYFDCFSGISGDMCLGALVDAGVSIKTLEKDLKKIPIEGYKLASRKVERNHVAAKKVDVVIAKERKGKGPKRWKDIEKVIRKSSLSEEIKRKGHAVFERIFKAEAKVHGESFDTVHLHELGAVDTIVDIFGTVIGLTILGIDKIYASPINLGSGYVELGSNVLPVPAPATAEILKNVPVYSRHTPCELTTPTGAAIIKELSSGFGDIPTMKIQKIGVGAGKNNFKVIPNVLRIFIGEQVECFEKHAEKVTVIEANIDDMNPQVYEYVMEKLFDAGALDVFLTQVIMKKGRPGVKITVLGNEGQREDLIRIILKETSTTGIRFTEMKRSILQREMKIIDTEFGKIRVKISRLSNGTLKMTPEYEDCKRIAKQLNIPLVDIIKKIT
jgi:uncharacterized protein (TIGR00299 family) protein